MADENLKQIKDEIVRHFDVVSEKLEDKIATVSEHIDVVSERLEDKIATVSEQVAGNTETLEIIKLDIEVIKNDLKQKVSREEFVILEKRVSALEAKRG